MKEEEWQIEAKRDNLQVAARLRRDITRLELEVEHYKKQFNRYESGSRKSALNIHPESKINLERYIEVFEPHLVTTGDFIRRSIEDRTGLDYESIMAGEF